MDSKRAKVDRVVSPKYCGQCPSSFNPLTPAYAIFRVVTTDGKIECFDLRDQGHINRLNNFALNEGQVNILNQSIAYTNEIENSIRQAGRKRKVGEIYSKASKIEPPKESKSKEVKMEITPSPEIKTKFPFEKLKQSLYFEWELEDFPEIYVLQAFNCPTDPITLEEFSEDDLPVRIWARDQKDATKFNLVCYTFGDLYQQLKNDNREPVSGFRFTQGQLDDFVDRYNLLFSNVPKLPRLKAKQKQGVSDTPELNLGAVHQIQEQFGEQAAQELASEELARQLEQEYSSDEGF